MLAAPYGGYKVETVWMIDHIDLAIYNENKCFKLSHHDDKIHT
jgi:hypothetical protein